MDCIALLSNMGNYKFEKIEEDIFGTRNRLEQAVQYHELLGHVQLTRKSSYWTMLFIINLFSYFIFLRMFKITEAGLGRARLDRLRKDLIDLIVLDELLQIYHDLWNPLQETIANACLLSRKKSIVDPELKTIIEKLVEENKKLKIIRELTDSSERIIEELGSKKGWELLNHISMYASSIKLIYFKELPKSPEDLMRIKKESYEIGYKIGKGRFSPINPTLRFYEMISKTERNINKLKKITSGAGLKNWVLNTSRICGHDTEMIEDQISFMTKYVNIIGESKEVIPDSERRNWIKETKRYILLFKYFTKIKFPLFWFISDINSGKIFFDNDRINGNDDLWSFLHLNIFKYQFLKGMKNKKNLIDCFDKKLWYCPSDCKNCYMIPLKKPVEDLYEITSDFSYEDLREEAKDTRSMKDRIFS